MNAELLHIESQHVKDEFERLRDLNKTMEAALAAAVEAYVDAVGESGALLRTTWPALDAPEYEYEWIEHFIAEGRRRLG